MATAKKTASRPKAESTEAPAKSTEAPVKAKEVPVKSQEVPAGITEETGKAIVERLDRIIGILQGSVTVERKGLSPTFWDRMLGKDA